MLGKSDFSIILGDFNARLKSWQKNVNINAGTRTDTIVASYGLNQLMTQTTHILINCSFNELTFIDQPSLVVDCGTHPSLHPKYHNQIIYC